MNSKGLLACWLILGQGTISHVGAFTPSQSSIRQTAVVSAANRNTEYESCDGSRRNALFSVFTSAPALVLAGISSSGGVEEAQAAAAAIQDTLDVETFLRTGMDVGGNMGVSSQAGKSRPQTGVVLRDGSDVLQDSKGGVLAEILTGTKANPVAVLAQFSTPLKLQTGPVFDVECRDYKSGDGVFLAVSRSTEGKQISDVSTNFLLERLFDPTGRFSFYGPPTDIKVKSNRMEGDYRLVEVRFSSLSQSTNAEIPRRALVVATIPEGTENAVMMVGSTTESRWNKGGQAQVMQVANTFRAVPAPKTGLKLRAKQRGDVIEF